MIQELIKLKREILPIRYKLNYSGIFFSIVLYAVLFIVWITARYTMDSSDFEELQVFILAGMLIWSLIFIIFIYKFVSVNKKLSIRRKCIEKAVASAEGKVKEVKEVIPEQSRKKDRGIKYYQLIVEYKDPADNTEKTAESELYARNPETFLNDSDCTVSVHIRKKKKPIVSVYRTVSDTAENESENTEQSIENN